MSRKIRYTPEEDAVIREMAAKGRSYTEIARALGRSDASVYTRATGALGVLTEKAKIRRKGPEWTPERDAELQRRLRSGAPKKKIAAAMKIGVQSVRKRMEALGLVASGPTGETRPRASAPPRAALARRVAHFSGDQSGLGGKGDHCVGIVFADGVKHVIGFAQARALAARARALRREGLSDEAIAAALKIRRGQLATLFQAVALRARGRVAPGGEARP